MYGSLVRIQHGSPDLGFFLVRPHRLAWPRTPPFHGGDAGSNPAGDAILSKVEPSNGSTKNKKASCKKAEAFVLLRNAIFTLFGPRCHAHLDGLRMMAGVDSVPAIFQESRSLELNTSQRKRGILNAFIGKSHGVSRIACSLGIEQRDIMLERRKGATPKRSPLWVRSL
jgi:hypothetical protein